MMFDWTPVSVSKPSDTGDYLVTIDMDYFSSDQKKITRREVTYAYYSVVYDEWYAGGSNVVAWIPLPTPYKEDQEDEEEM